MTKQFELDLLKMNAIQSMLGTNSGRTVVMAAHLSALLLLAGPVSALADVREAVKRALPATVGIEWCDAAGNVPARVEMASGTIVSANGFVVTIIGSTASRGYSVTLSDGRVFDGRLVVDDRRSGLKLLKIEGADLPFISLFHEPLQIGEEVTTTSCQDLRDRIAARGIVAAKERELDGLGDSLLQLDMTVGPMSGGSPLADEQGRLRGIIAFLRSGKPISFALPTTQVQTLLDVPQSDSPTVIHRGILGIQLKEIEKDDGRVVAHPIAGSPAANAGLREGDWILALDGIQVDSLKDVRRLLHRRAAGDEVHLTIRRDGQKQELAVTLAQPPDENTRSRSRNDVPASVRTAAWNIVQPAQIYIVDNDNVVRVVTGEAAVQIVESLRKSEAGGASNAESPAKQSLPDIGGAKGASAPPDVIKRSGPTVDGTEPGSPAVIPSTRVARQVVPSTRIERQVIPSIRVERQVIPSIRVERQVTPSIRVERSDLGKKVEQLSRDAQSLRQQIEKLTEEVERLRK